MNINLQFYSLDQAQALCEEIVKDKGKCDGVTLEGDNYTLRTSSDVATTSLSSWIYNPR